MARRTAVAALVALTALPGLGCRTDAVQLGFDPEAGTTYEYRYEVDATVTRAVEGEEPRTTSVPQSSARTAQVVVDRAGSLQAIQDVDGLPAEAVGLPSTADLLASTSVEPPAGALSLGAGWDVGLGTVRGHARLDHFEVLDGVPAAVVETDLVEVLTETIERSGSHVVLDGDLRSSGHTAFDLDDGSVRRSRTLSRGTVDVLVSPPTGVLAPAVEAVVTYELRVTATRVG
jgi:hypothetical protein